MFGTILHHFYIIEGSAETVDRVREELEESQGLIIRANPDFAEMVHESFGIDESRALKEFFTTRSLGEGKKVALVIADRMTGDAQNALLKISEEPGEGQHLLLIVPSIGMIIETLKSRAQIIVVPQEEEKQKEIERQIETSDFLKLSVPKRLAFVQKLITKKDRQAAAECIDQIIAVLKKEKKHAALAQAYQCRSYITDQSSSLKLILEHISLIL